MKKIIAIAAFSTVFFSCNKDDNHSCYDPSLVHNDACTADCPGFIGCDGMTYCNQCEAARVGIGPQ